MSGPRRGSRVSARAAWTLQCAVALLVALVAAGQLSAGHSSGRASVSLQRPHSPDAGTQASGAHTEESPGPLRSGRETVLPRGQPLAVVIPSIGVDADLVPIGLEPNRHMEVPDFGLAGWYTEGPRPGHPGPSVIAAHVASRRGPDVFHRLRELVPGDEVHVVYDSGEQVTFVVRSPPVRTPKDSLPADDIWPVTSERLLTLITCGGRFNRATGHYDDNVIVYTVPAPLDEPPGSTGPARRALLGDIRGGG